MIIPGTKISVYMNLDDIGLFKRRKPHEEMSQRERAEQIRDAFGHCMSEALNHRHCVMPEYCATGQTLSCAHLEVYESTPGQVAKGSPGLAMGYGGLLSGSSSRLIVDYGNFTGRGIPLTGRARAMIDGRLRAIGTLVYRHECRLKGGVLPGDAHVRMLEKPKFPARKAKAGSMPKAKPKSRGAFSWLFG